MIPRGRRARTRPASAAAAPAAPGRATPSDERVLFREPPAKRICFLGPGGVPLARAPVRQSRVRSPVLRLCDAILVEIAAYLSLLPHHHRLLLTCRRFAALVASPACWTVRGRLRGVVPGSLEGFKPPSPLALTLREGRPSPRQEFLYDLILGGRCCVCFRASPLPVVFTRPFRVVFCRGCREALLKQVRAIGRSQAVDIRLVLRGPSLTSPRYTLKPGIEVAVHPGFDPLGVLALFLRLRAGTSVSPGGRGVCHDVPLRRQQRVAAAAASSQRATSPSPSEASEGTPMDLDDDTSATFSPPPSEAPSLFMDTC